MAHLGQEYDISHAVFSVHHTRGPDVLCAVIGDVYFHLSVKVRSTRFPTVKGFSPFVFSM